MPGAVPHRPIGKRPCLLGILARDHHRQAGKRRNNALDIARCLGDRERLLEHDAGLGKIPALAVDLADQLQGIRHHVRVDLAVAKPRGLEVGERLLDATHAQLGLATIAEAQREEARERRELREAHRHVQLLQRLGVGTLLHEMRATVGPDAHHLENVGRLLRRAQREQVVRVVASPVSVERRQHRHHRVGGGERSVVAAAARGRQSRGSRAPGTARRPRESSARSTSRRAAAPSPRDQHRGRRPRADRRSAPRRARRAGSESGRCARRGAPGARRDPPRRAGSRSSPRSSRPGSAAPHLPAARSRRYEGAAGSPGRPRAPSRSGRRRAASTLPS